MPKYNIPQSENLEYVIQNLIRAEFFHKKKLNQNETAIKVLSK